MKFKTRRIIRDTIRLVGRSPDDYAQELQELLELLQQHAVGAIPAGFNNVTPKPTTVNIAAAAGTQSQGWTAADHIHALNLGLTAKGDLLSFDGSLYGRLPVGTDGQVLTADSPSSLGLKWAAASGGSGGANVLDLVESHDFAAAATSYTFSTGVAGDTDELYMLQYRILDAVGGSFFTIQPNAITANQRTKRQLFGSFAGPGVDTLDLALCDPNAFASGSIGDVFSGHGWFYAKTGLVRLWQNVFDWYRASDAALFGVQNTAFWTDTATAITSFAIVSNTALAIGIGSFVRLYKLRKVSASLAPTWARTLAMAGA